MGAKRGEGPPCGVSADLREGAVAQRVDGVLLGELLEGKGGG